MTFLDRMVHHFHLKLLESSEGRDYLMGRGSSDDQWSRHQIGFVDEQWIPESDLDPGHSEECEETPSCDSCKFIKWAGGESSWKLNDRVIYPITTYSGAVCGIQTRSIKEKLYDTFTLSKRAEAHFFMTAGSMSSLYKNRYVVLTEGPSDALVAERMLNLPTLSVLTNSLNVNQARFIDRFVDTIYLMFDNDQAGRDGTLKTVRSFSPAKTVVDIRVKTTDMKDPADIWRALGDLKCKKEMQFNLPPALRR